MQVILERAKLEFSSIVRLPGDPCPEKGRMLLAYSRRLKKLVAREVAASFAGTPVHPGEARRTAEAIIELNERRQQARKEAKKCFRTQKRFVGFGYGAEGKRPKWKLFAGLPWRPSDVRAEETK